MAAASGAPRFCKSMNRFSSIVLACLLGLGIEAHAATLNVTSGHVRYEVVIKTFGVGGSTIVGTNKALIGNIQTAADGRVHGGLIIPVVDFESNNTRRDKDVAKILKYKEHPAITFEVLEMKQSDIEAVLGSERGEVPMKARITAAGGSKVFDMVLRFERAGENKLKCSTEVDAKFSDFGIKPPTLGLIIKRAPDAIKLSGELIYEVLED